MFEPVHVRLPDIAEEASPPHRQIWSGAMMLRHLEIPTLPMPRECIAAVLPKRKFVLRILEESLPPGTWAEAIANQGRWERSNLSRTKEED